MATPQTRSARALLKTAHTWIGLIAGIFLVAIGLTGTVILFRAEFETAGLPHYSTVGPLVSLDKAAAEVQKQVPDGQIRRVRLPEAPGAPLIFQVQGPQKKTVRIAADSISGRVVGTVRSDWMDWMVDLHRNLLSGPTGRKAVGYLGIALFILSISGFVMWLSGSRRWQSWISVRRGATVRFHYELHRASGLWAYGLLAVLSFTGIERAFPETFRHAIQSVTGRPATVAAPKKNKNSPALHSLDEYVAAAMRVMPDGVPAELRLPPPGSGPIDLRLYRKGDIAPSGNHVYLEPATASVVMVDRVADRPAGARFLGALAPIHYGQFGGTGIKIVWAICGIAPLILFITGFITWRRPLRQRVPPAVAARTDSDDVVLVRR